MPKIRDIVTHIQFQSTPSLRKVTRVTFPVRKFHLFQSTPSLRKVTLIKFKHIIRLVFQSTPSLRKVTIYSDLLEVVSIISIHTFLAEGDPLTSTSYVRRDIFQSTPSLRKVTLRLLRRQQILTVFQSTPSLRKVTCESDVKSENRYISIHTFLAEGDHARRAKQVELTYFNPHLPCGR